MIEVEMIDDVRKTDPKFIGPFNKRQCVCLLISASYAIPFIVFVPGDIVVRILIGFALAFPVAACGWIKLNKEPFEIVAARYIYKHFLTPRKRKCKRENSYKAALTKVRRQAEKERVAKMSPRKRKAYEKKMKKGKTVIYSRKKAYKVYK